MSALVIALILFVLALVIFAIDLMIPSGGVLIAVTAIIGFASIVFAFRHNPTTGLTMLVVCALSMPAMLLLFLKIWPKTPLGRRLISKPESQGTFVWSDASKIGDTHALIGARGIAVSELLPSGRVRIGEQTFEGFSETGPIEAGAAIQVIRIDVGRLVVSLYREHAPDEEPMSSGSGLDRPISELDLDSIQ